MSLTTMDHPISDFLGVDRAKFLIPKDPASFTCVKHIDHKIESFISGTSDHCATNSLEKRDAMKIWQAMKQNGFLTPVLGQMSTPKKQCMRHRNDTLRRKMPTQKQRNEKCRIDIHKRDMKVAKVQQVNRFAKVAASSGLLDELNPGIINRIRSSEQVFSVIEALVRRDKMGNVNVNTRQAENREKRFNENGGNGCPSSLLGRGQLGIHSGTLRRLLHMGSKQKRRVGDLGIAVRKEENEGDKDELKFSTPTNTITENASNCVCNGKSANASSGPSLSQDSATVASQWLQFLQRDIARRLSALRCSRRRVQDVIQAELPFLLVKEFSLNQENEQLSAAGCLNSISINMHRAKWNALFDQMDKALNEEANQLERWLNQLIEMQSHSRNWYGRHFLEPLGTSDCDTRKF